MGGRSQWSIPPHPTVSRRGAPVTCVCGCLAPTPAPRAFQGWPVCVRAGGSSFFRLFGHSQPPTPHHQVCLGIWGQGGGRNLETLAPGTLFCATFPFHAGPCSAGKRFAVGRVRAPRTWPKSAEAGTFLGEAPGASWILAYGEKKHLYLRAILLPFWPYPGRAIWHLGLVPLWTHQQTPGLSGVGRETRPE